MNMLEETWKLLTNISHNEFAISNLGRIVHLKTQFFVRPYMHKSRGNYYLRVALGDKKYMVHVLVATMFKDKPGLEYVEVHHIDGNTLNPAATNVEWTTKNWNKTIAWHYRRVNFNGQIFTAQYRPFKR